MALMECICLTDSCETRSLRYNGDALSTEASMTCMILACCECDRVPAFIFARPYGPRRRWNNHGEIELADPPPAEKIPQWPLNIFDAPPLPSPGNGNRVEGSLRGIMSSAALGLPLQLSPHIEQLCQRSIISTEFDGKTLFFRMPKSTREEIWEQTWTQDRLLLWFDLLELVVYSSPDVYAEVFWKNIINSVKPVIDSTIVPFLSILEWTHLQQHQAM